MWAWSCDQLLSYARIWGFRHWDYSSDVDRQGQCSLTGPQYCWAGVGVLAPQRASAHTFVARRGRSAPLLLGGGESPDVLWGLLWRHPVREGKKALLMPGRDGSPGPPCGPCWPWGRKSQLSIYSSLMPPWQMLRCLGTALLRTKV